MSVYAGTKDRTRIPDVELHKEILSCAEEKSRVISALYAAQALGDSHCFLSINILISAPVLKP